MSGGARHFPSNRLSRAARSSQPPYPPSRSEAASSSWLRGSGGSDSAATIAYDGGRVSSNPRGRSERNERDASRTLAGWSLIIAPLLLLLWNAIDPATSDHAAERLSQIADHGPRYIVAGYLGLIGAWAFVPGLIGLWWLFRGPRVTLGQVGSGLMLIGIITTIAFFGLGVYEYEAAQPGYDRAQMARLADSVEAPSRLAIPLLVVFLLGLVLGSLVVAWSLWRRRLVPLWSPAAIVVGTILNFLSDSPALGAIASAFTLVGFGWVGVRLLSMSAEEWDPRGQTPRLSESPTGASG